MTLTFEPMIAVIEYNYIDNRYKVQTDLTIIETICLKCTTAKCFNERDNFVKIILFYNRRRLKQ